MLSASYENDSPNMLSDEEMDIAKQIGLLEYEIDEFLRSQGNNIDLKTNRNRCVHRIDSDIIQKLDTLSTQELWTNLSTIIEEFNQIEHNEAEKNDINKRIRNVVLDILVSSAKKGEQIDLNSISQFCSIEDLVEAMQNALINKAQEQEVKERTNILHQARVLNEKNITNPVLWQNISGAENVTIVDLKPQRKEKIQQPKNNNTETTALTVVNQKLSLFDRIRGIFGIKQKQKGTCVYTFGDINPDTGEWENVTLEYGKYAKVFSKKKAQRLLGIEINDVSLNDDNTEKYEYRAYIIERCPNLQKLVFGRVKETGGEAFSEINSLKYVEISDYVATINHASFKNCKSLEEISMGENISEIKWNAFLGCESLKGIDIPDKTEMIDGGAFANCKRLKHVSIGEGTLVIGVEAFSNCISLESINIPNRIRKIGNYAFQYCENLKNISFGKGIQEFTKMRRI